MCLNYFCFIFRTCYYLHNFFYFCLQERNNQWFEKKMTAFFDSFYQFLYIFVAECCLINAISELWYFDSAYDFFYICLFLWFSCYDFHVFMFFLLYELLYLLSIFIKNRNNWQFKRKIIAFFDLFHQLSYIFVTECCLMNAILKLQYFDFVYDFFLMFIYFHDFLVMIFMLWFSCFHVFLILWTALSISDVHQE